MCGSVVFGLVCIGNVGGGCWYSCRGRDLLL